MYVCIRLRLGGARLHRDAFGGEFVQVQFVTGVALCARVWREGDVEGHSWAGKIRHCASRATASVSVVRTELVTTLKRKATEIIDGLQEPILITQHGLPAAYLLNVEAYEALRERVALLEGIARGERAIEKGRTVSHPAAKKRLARWLS